MRCILRPLLFFQSIFYLVIGRVIKVFFLILKRNEFIGAALLTWSIIYGEEKFSQWDGTDLSYFAVGNIVAGSYKEAKIFIQVFNQYDACLHCASIECHGQCHISKWLTLNSVFSK